MDVSTTSLAMPACASASASRSARKRLPSTGPVADVDLAARATRPHVAEAIRVATVHRLPARSGTRPRQNSAEHVVTQMQLVHRTPNQARRSDADDEAQGQVAGNDGGQGRYGDDGRAGGKLGIADGPTTRPAQHGQGDGLDVRSVPAGRSAGPIA